MAGRRDGPPGPLFVAGPPRSGTSMLRSILNLSPEVGLAGETHYFDDLRPRITDPRAPLHGGELDRARKYFLRLSHRNYGFQGDAELASLAPDELDGLATTIGGSADAYFEAFCRLSGGAGPANGVGVRWGEKTPRHVFRIADMLAAYPSAQVVCMVRDPRAVVASYAQWRATAPTGADVDPEDAEVLEHEAARARQSFHAVIASFMVKGAIEAAEKARDQHGGDRVRLVRYESLVDDPRGVLTDLCAWLGIAFTEVLLDTRFQNSSFAQTPATGGVHARSRDRWKATLEPAEIAVVQVLCSKLMERWGYERIDVAAPAWKVAGEFATVPVAAVRAAGANRDRIASLPDYVLRRVLPGRRG